MSKMDEFRGKRDNAIDWLVDKLAKLISIIAFFVLIILWVSPQYRGFAQLGSILFVVFIITAGWSLVTTARLSNEDFANRFAFYGACLLGGGFAAFIFGSIAINYFVVWWQVWWPPW